MLRNSIARCLVAPAVALLAIVLATPAQAQSTGIVKGKVTDAKGQPVEGAKVTMENPSAGARKYEVTSNKKGEFIQIGLQPGSYKIIASKEGVGAQQFDVRVRVNSPVDLTFQLSPNSGGDRPMSKEDAAKMQGFKAAFDAGIAANNAGSFDDAIAKFTEALAAQPDCYPCQFNLGSAYSQKKEYDKAEEAFKKAMTMKPDSPEPYNALANVYNSQRKFDEAAKMGEEAAKHAAAGGPAGGSPDQLYNQGIIFWNAGKIAEAKSNFEAAVAAKPDLADAHYWLGMAMLNEGKMPEAATHFEEYVKLAPSGQYAAQAKGVLSQIKK